MIRSLDHGPLTTVTPLTSPPRAVRPSSESALAVGLGPRLAMSAHSPLQYGLRDPVLRAQVPAELLSERSKLRAAIDRVLVADRDLLLGIAREVRRIASTGEVAWGAEEYGASEEQLIDPATVERIDAWVARLRREVPTRRRAFSLGAARDELAALTESHRALLEFARPYAGPNGSMRIRTQHALGDFAREFETLRDWLNTYEARFEPEV